MYDCSQLTATCFEKTVEAKLYLKLSLTSPHEQFYNNKV